MSQEEMEHFMGMGDVYPSLIMGMGDVYPSLILSGIGQILLT